MPKRYITDMGHKPVLISQSGGETTLGQYGVWEFNGHKFEVIAEGNDLRKLQTKYGPGLEVKVIHGKTGTEMTAEDRANLIRMASELPAGDETRRAILAGLNKISARKLSDIAREIRKDWKQVHYGAKPYLEAMAEMDSVHDNYGQDPGKSIVLYFLNNASSWRGDVAKQIKAELKAMVR